MQQGNLKAAYSTTKKIRNQQTKKIDAVKDRNVKMLSAESEMQYRWQKYFCELLNRPDLNTQ